MRERNRQLAKLKREAQLEAFRLEREREQSNYERLKLMPRSRSDSPRHLSKEELRPDTPESGSEIPHAPIFAKYMKPKQMQAHLTKLRKGLLQSNKRRPQSASPIRTESMLVLPHTRPYTSASGSSWEYYSTPSGQYESRGYDLYSPQTLSPAVSTQSGLSSHAPSSYGRDMADKYGYDLYGSLPHISPRNVTPPRSRTSSRSPPRPAHQSHHMLSPRDYHTSSSRDFDSGYGTAGPSHHAGWSSTRDPARIPDESFYSSSHSEYGYAGTLL